MLQYLTAVQIARHSKLSRANGFQTLIFVPCDHTCPECVVVWGYYKLYVIIKRPHAIGAMNNLLLSFMCVVIKWNKLGAKYSLFFISWVHQSKPRSMPPASRVGIAVLICICLTTLRFFICISSPNDLFIFLNFFY